MQLNNHHLTYCTNIHAGDSWAEAWEGLQTYLPAVKEKFSPHQPFGVGLRLSVFASRELNEKGRLEEFKAWLDANDMYVFTMNGFPYGGFYAEVKDEVHWPDWRTQQRLDYTIELFDQLAVLLPDDMEGGISTSPLSYKPWLNEVETSAAFEFATRHMAKVAYHLHQLEASTGHYMHLDIEPEPDGLIENTAETIHFFKQWLIPKGGQFLQEEHQLTAAAAEAMLYRHINVCYDVCHFAVEYEQPAEVFQQLENNNIRVGKIQISAALKADLPANLSERAAVMEAFSTFNESTYLHQVIARDANGEFTNYNDLPKAMEHANAPTTVEWRTHFHVPIFLEEYGVLQSTRQDIVEVLDYVKQKEVTSHLEVETYTWDVLPKTMKTNLADSIVRELEWVKQQLDA